MMDSFLLTLKFMERFKKFTSENILRSTDGELDFVSYLLLIHQEKAEALNLCGWVKNTKKGTVIGTAQGELENLEELKQWLTTTG